MKVQSLLLVAVMFCGIVCFQLNAQKQKKEILTYQNMTFIQTNTNQILWKDRKGRVVGTFDEIGHIYETSVGSYLWLIWSDLDIIDEGNLDTHLLSTANYFFGLGKKRYIITQNQTKFCIFWQNLITFAKCVY